MSWSEIYGEKTKEIALAQCRGSYQRDLVLGAENWSGSTLRGAAKSWGSRYKQSREALMRRLRAAGLDVWVDVQDHGRKILVIDGREVQS